MEIGLGSLIYKLTTFPDTLQVGGLASPENPLAQLIDDGTVIWLGKVIKTTPPLGIVLAGVNVKV